MEQTSGQNPDDTLLEPLRQSPSDLSRYLISTVCKDRATAVKTTGVMSKEAVGLHYELLMISDMRVVPSLLFYRGFLYTLA